MIMESVSAMRPVIAVTPQHFLPDQHFQSALDRLQQQKLILQLPIGQLYHHLIELMQLQPLTQEPSLNLAAQLQPRLQ